MSKNHSSTAELYLKDAIGANKVIQKSSLIQLTNSQTEATKLIREKKFQYVDYGIDLSLETQEIKCELLDSSGRTLTITNMTRLNKRKGESLMPGKSILVVKKTELKIGVYQYGPKIPFKPYKVKPLHCIKC